MYKKYLAKSNGETIQEHTDKLIEKMEDFNNLYPNVLNTKILKYLLHNACLYHDIGKVNENFQAIMRREKPNSINIPHGFLSLAYIDVKKFLSEIEEILKDELEKERNIEKFGAIISPKKYLNVLINAIAYHHERQIKIELEDIENEIGRLGNIKDFHYEKINIPKKLKLPNERYFSLDRRLIPRDDEQEFELVLLNYILIKGLLNKIDYCASSETDIEIEVQNDFLEESLKTLLKKWKKTNSEACWNELQQFMLENKDENVISIAQTGMGKTEAGLLWIGDQKGFFVLPIRTAINAIYQRIINEIVEEENIKKIGLLHSETYERYIEAYEEEGGEALNKYYLETKQLSLPFTVCTLDQLFDFVYMYGGSEVKLATLSYSKIVLDEIQMYSWNLLSYIINGLKSITKLGGKFAILTATFPPFIEDLLRENGIEFKKSKAYVKQDLMLRHSIKLIENEINVEIIRKLYNKNKILVICNTIKAAQRIYDELRIEIDEDELNLFHSKYIRRDKNKKEKEILEIGNKKSQKYGIWVTTQVVEASLDIDFDLLFTELSDLNGLFQRMGRCYRNREYDEKYKYNCYVYIEEENKKCSGIGAVIDDEIFYLSKELLKEKFLKSNENGEIKRKIYEDEKMKYVEELYSTNNLKSTNYYQQLKNSLDYISYLSPFEMEKKDAKQKFRDIIAFPVIPKNIYEENKDYIDELLNKNEFIRLNLKGNLEKEEKIELKIELRKNKNLIKDLSLNLEDKYFRNIEKVKEIILDKYQSISICECDYSNKYGFKANQKNKKWDSDNFI
ncbi:CRISPR-associated helicase/endonuclease Cas3 [Fusobacterium russii]|uniref:CRISPR-associated helicase/endonuclease Cas3 n=1 Tax=Fusobacterium russii TaxID=854 RepID=UPI0003A6D0C6|nr:CRISPR-associated helicase/endonuclease Cas3 [Fusobacterium russii]